MAKKSTNKKAAVPAAEPATPGGILAEVRRAAGLSQSDFAALAGVNVSSVRNWEQGRFSPLADEWLRLIDLAGAKITVKPARGKPPVSKGGPKAKE